MSENSSPVEPRGLDAVQRTERALALVRRLKAVYRELVDVRDRDAFRRRIATACSRSEGTVKNWLKRRAIPPEPVLDALEAALRPVRPGASEERTEGSGA